MRNGRPNTRAECERFYSINDLREEEVCCPLYRPTIDRIKLGARIMVWNTGQFPDAHTSPRSIGKFGSRRLPPKTPCVYSANGIWGQMVERIDYENQRILVRHFIGGSREGSWWTDICDVFSVGIAVKGGTFFSAYSEFRQFSDALGRELNSTRAHHRTFG